VSLYGAYGLTLACDEPLPLRPALPGALPDLDIVYLGRAPPEPPSGGDRRKLVRDGNAWVLRYDNERGGWMAFDHRPADRRLVVSGSVDWTVCAAALCGVVCGAILRLSGATALHAACVTIDCRAVAILGSSGFGKSTLSAALMTEGADLLTEDLLLLQPADGGYDAQPGAASLHLLEDGRDWFGPALAARGFDLSPAVDNKVRIALPADTLRAAAAAPLAALIVLDPPATARAAGMERLSGAAALSSLAANLYGIGWAGPATPDDLRFCALLSREVPVFSLARAWGLDGLADTAALLRRSLDAGFLSPRTGA
jgi:hypothetical protein